MAITKDCLKVERVRDVLQRLFDRYTVEEIAEQSLAIDVQLLGDLSDAFGVPLILTGGWFQTLGKPCYQHGPELVEALLADGIGSRGERVIPMHFWFTSPAGEIFDALIPTIIAVATGNKSATAGVVYFSNQASAPHVTYHPTVLGLAFLEQVGAV